MSSSSPRTVNCLFSSVVDTATRLPWHRTAPSQSIKSGEDFPLAALRGLEEELGIVQATLSRVAYFEFCYGPNDNKISQLFEGVVHPDSVHIDPQEVERVFYHSLPELLAIRDARTAQFSRWFEQLLLWYGRRPSQLRILEMHHGLFQPAEPIAPADAAAPRGIVMGKYQMSSRP